MIKDLTLANSALSSEVADVTGITFEAESIFSTTTTFPLSVTIGGSEIVPITFDPTVKSGDYSETITVHISNGTDKIHTITATDTGIEVILDYVFVGVRTVPSTDVLLATKFASPTGTGDGTFANPYSITNALNSLVAGDVLFLRGGNYDIPTSGTGLKLSDKIGTHYNRIIIESYPNETAVLNGGNTTAQNVIDQTYDTGLGFWIDKCEYLSVRKIEVTGMSSQGIYMTGRHNRLQGLDVHHNFLTGIQVANRQFNQTPYVDGWNLIEDCYSRHNSDAGIPSGGWGEHDNGGNADGISISSGQFNKVRYSEVDSCSDDGIDSWLSNDTIFEYCVAHDLGISTGNGNGFKTGGNINDPSTNGLRCIVRYCVSYNNKANGFDQNAGKYNELYNCTSYDNGGKGFAYDTATQYVDRIENCISQDNATGHTYADTDSSRINNSWQISGDDVIFESTDDAQDDFLIPTDNRFTSIGAKVSALYKNPTLPTTVPIWIAGDSTVAYYTVGEALRGWGMSLKDNLLTNPTRVFNHARSGASSKSYIATNDQTDPNNLGLFWGDGVTANSSGNKGILQSMIEADTSNGGYVLICFGHNDIYLSGEAYSSTRSVPNEGNEFDIAIMKMITDARENGVTPILVTCSSQMSVYHNADYYRLKESSLSATTPTPYEYLQGEEGDWMQTIRDIGERENVLMLDLMTQSFTHYFTFPTNADIQTAYSGDGGDVHTNQAGADMLANLIKDEADSYGLGFSEQFI